MTPTPSPIDTVFRALSDATRRQVIERLCHGPASVSDLAKPFDMALPSFVRHLKVLEDAGLVHSKKQGRVRTYALEPDSLAVVDDWLSNQHTIWTKRLDRLDTYLTSEENS